MSAVTATAFDEVLELSREAVPVAVRCERGVPAVPAGDLALHAPDLHLLGLRRGSLVARCSCWWSGVSPVGAIGHYAAADLTSGAAILTQACERLSRAGCLTAVGPMNGNTWRDYRFVVERGNEPTFFLEPENPDEWPRHWAVAGFSTCASYTSALNENLTAEDPRTAAALDRLRAAGISLRSFVPHNADWEIGRMFSLASVVFRQNAFYAPIAEAEFRRQIEGLLPAVRPELILIAEQHDALVGFIFALPDLLEARRGTAPRTAILKTLAVDPSVSGLGLGGVLMDLVQRQARQLGFHRAIHALMHEANRSRWISRRYARTIRRYALFSRPLGRMS
jgi:GNAT superfamily N-acetyltransferase